MPTRPAILIYTVAADPDGTLGGLVDLGKPENLGRLAKHPNQPDELASKLLVDSHVFTKTANQQTTELVWMGPTTPFVSARRTEHALLQVINGAIQTLFITSFVAYDVSTIVNALNAASDRGVVIPMLFLEGNCTAL